MKSRAWNKREGNDRDIGEMGSGGEEIVQKEQQPIFQWRWTLLLWAMGRTRHATAQTWIHALQGILFFVLHKYGLLISTVRSLMCRCPWMDDVECRGAMDDTSMGKRRSSGKGSIEQRASWPELEHPHRSGLY